ncbi:MAG TPA: helix-hairpin-helix domain-containing protein [Thermomicrobiales bacterium]|jgi:DNA polymerase (family 10)
MSALSNPRIAALLREYADLLELRGESAFRTLAYRRGADAIVGLDRPAGGLSAAELQAIEGIGKGISGTIVEIARRGSFGSLDELRQVIPASVIRFTDLPGVGVKTAARLYELLGVATLDALQEAADAGKIAATKGLGARVEQTVRDGLSQLALYAGRHGIGAALPLAEQLMRLLRERGVPRVALAGSLRRWADTVGDIDLLAIAADPDALLDTFAALPLISEVNERGERDIRVTLDGGLSAQLRVVTADRWGGELVAWSSAEGHRVALREFAEGRGLGDPFAPSFAEEADLYAALGLPLIPPELREGRGEVAAALAGRLPRLITRDDLRGDFHSHSTWSDGRATIAEMAAAAIARGYAYLGVSDHTHGLTVANGLDETRIRAQWLEIDRLNAELAPFRLLKSAEVEIRRDGSLDLPDAVLAELDIVIASLHSGLRGDRATVTERLVRAINNPHVDIIAHPSGRIVGGRGGADYDWDAVLAAAAATSTALEINAAPERLDLTDETARRALDAGVRLTIDCDAHSIDNLDLMPFGIGVARRAWATADLVLNTRPLDEVLAWAAR